MSQKSGGMWVVLAVAGVVLALLVCGSVFALGALAGLAQRADRAAAARRAAASASAERDRIANWRPPVETVVLAEILRRGTCSSCKRGPVERGKENDHVYVESPIGTLMHTQSRAVPGAATLEAPRPWGCGAPDQLGPKVRVRGTTLYEVQGGPLDGAVVRVIYPGTPNCFALLGTREWASARGWI